MSFVNKLDREGRDPLDLLDEIENVLGIQCAPMTWPIGMGRSFRGIYHLREDRAYLYQGRDGSRLPESLVVEGLDTDAAANLLGPEASELREQIDSLITGSEQN